MAEGASGLIMDAGLAIETLAASGDNTAIQALERFNASGDLSGLEVELRRLADQKAVNERTAERYRELGSITFLDDIAKALRAYERAVELDPQNPDGWRHLGVLQLRAGDLNSAIKSLGLVLTNPRANKRTVSIAAFNLGSVYAVQGDDAKASEMYLRALKFSEELGDKEKLANDYSYLADFFLNRDSGRAEQIAGKAIALYEELGHKADLSDAYSILGNIKFQKGDFTIAEQILTKAVAAGSLVNYNEGIAYAHLNLGILYSTSEYAGHDMAKACAYWQKAYELYSGLGDKKEPRHRDLQEAAAQLLRRCNCPGGAKEWGSIEAYERAAALSPDDFNALNNLGTLLLEAGKLDRAAVSFEKVKALGTVWGKGQLWL